MNGDFPHQTSESPLPELKMPMISGFPLDYMHMVLEGVQKTDKILEGIIKGQKRWCIVN